MIPNFRVSHYGNYLKSTKGKGFKAGYHPYATCCLDSTHEGLQCPHDKDVYFETESAAIDFMIARADGEIVKAEKELKKVKTAAKNLRKKYNRP